MAIRNLFRIRIPFLSRLRLIPGRFGREFRRNLWGEVLAIFTIAIISLGLLLTIIVGFIYIVYIINASSFVVPGTLGPALFLPPGTTFNCAGAGAEVHPPGSTLQLLPDTTPPRPLGICFQPTEIVIHWSGGWNGVQGTYNTLVARNVSCHLATDDSTTLQMLGMWETMVELSYCHGSYNPDHNYMGIGIEMSGLCFSSTNIAACGYGTIVTPPPPAEFQRTVNLACWLRQQYNITDIVGHYEIDPINKTDPGVDFLQNIFIPAVNSQCP